MRNSVRQAEVDRGEREDLLSEERQRLRELEGENKRFKQEREVLKAAGAYFGRSGRFGGEGHRGRSMAMPVQQR